MLEMIEANLLAALRARHSEPQRHYHDWSHVEALLRHAETIRGQLQDETAVVHAIVFHDAIYDPAAKDNEPRARSC